MSINSRKALRYIEVSSRFIAFHQYPDAPEQVAFLREPHRHVFHVLAQLYVQHDDRDLEFFMVQAKLNAFLREWEGENLGARSCEMLAEAIALYLEACYPERVRLVSVSEDGENRGVMEYV